MRLPALLLLLLPALAQAQADLLQRDAEIAECRAGEVSTWPDGRDRPAIARHIRFAYEQAGAPAWLSREQVLQALRLAASSWSRCGSVRGEVVASGQAAEVRVVWSESGSRGNFGLADLGRRTLSLGPQAFALLKQRNPAHPAGQTLQMVISHEMGHFFGLMAHSRRCVDVLYYTDGKGGHCKLRSGTAPRPGVEYRALLPTACDIQRCIAANPAANSADPAR